MTPQNIPEDLKPLPQWVCRNEAKEPLNPRTGKRASVTNPNDWGTFDEVTACVEAGQAAGAGFVLTENDPFAFIDLDVKEGQQPTAEQQEILAQFEGYAEFSPSGRGLHIIVKGELPSGRRRGNVEVYSSGRYMTMTGNVFRSGPILDQGAKLGELWEQLGGGNHTEAAEVVASDPNPATAISDERLVELICGATANADHYHGKNVTDWSSSYFALICAAGLFSSDEAQVHRVVMASPLVQNSPPAANSETRPQKAARLWPTEYPRAAARGAQERQQQAQEAARGAQLAAGMGQLVTGQVIGAHPFSVEIGEASEKEMTLDFYIDHLLPKKSPILVAGMGSSGKSSLVASWCAEVSRNYSALWISSEEQTAWVRTRHAKAGGSYDTIATVPLMPTQKDLATGKVTATTFGIYAHLEDAILDAKSRLGKPLGIVVLDAVSALVDWKKGESPNDDASVKRAIGFLKGLAETYDLCVIMIHHFNKSQAASYDPNKVTGAPAWVTSPRLAFAVTKDDASESDFDSFIQVIKTNLGMRFGASFTTVPVHVLAKYNDAPDSVLCSARLNGGLVWGDREVKLLVNHGEDPDAEKRSAHKKNFDNKVQHVARAIRGGATTRVDVAMVISGSGCGGITTNQWAKIDPILQEKFGIDVRTISHGKILYSVRQPASGEAQPWQVFLS